MCLLPTPIPHPWTLACCFPRRDPAPGRAKEEGLVRTLHPVSPLSLLLTSLLLVGLLVLATLLGGGCSFQCGNVHPAGGETPSTGPTPIPPGPEETPSAGPGEEAAGPKVVVLEVGDQFDPAKREGTHKTDTFTPETKAIYVSAGSKGLEKDATITGTLKAVEVTTKDGTKIRDHEVASTDMKAPGEESTVNFTFSAPTAGWPKGTYVVEIGVEGKVIETRPDRGVGSNVTGAKGKMVSLSRGAGFQPASLGRSCEVLSPTPPRNPRG